MWRLILIGIVIVIFIWYMRRTREYFEIAEPFRFIKIASTTEVIMSQFQIVSGNIDMKIPKPVTTEATENDNVWQIDLGADAVVDKIIFTGEPAAGMKMTLLKSNGTQVGEPLDFTMDKIQTFNLKTGKVESNSPPPPTPPPVPPPVPPPTPPPVPPPAKLSIESTIKGWIQRIGNDDKTSAGQNQTPESCKKMAALEPDKYAGWGFRTDQHPSAAHKNTCFLYRKNNIVPWADYNDPYHLSGCVNPGEKIEWGCRTSPSSLPGNISRVMGWTGAGHESLPEQDLNNMSEEKCRELAQKEPDKYAAWGFRNNTHPDEKYKNTCFLYEKKDMVPFDGNPSDTIHSTGCLNPSELVEFGCNKTYPLKTNSLYRCKEGTSKISSTDVNIISLQGDQKLYQIPIAGLDLSKSKKPINDINCAGIESGGPIIVEGVSYNCKPGSAISSQNGEIYRGLKNENPTALAKTIGHYPNPDVYNSWGAPPPNLVDCTGLILGSPVEMKTKRVFGNNGTVTCNTYCGGTGGASWNNELASESWTGASCATSAPNGCDAMGQTDCVCQAVPGGRWN